MTTFNLTASAGGTGPQSILQDGDDLVVHPGVVLSADAAAVIFARGDNTILLAQDVALLALGSVPADNAGILFFSSGVEDEAYLDVARGASITAQQQAIYSNLPFDEVQVVNHGAITSFLSAAIELNGDDNKVVNHGTVTGDDAGISVWDVSQVFNHGTVSASRTGISARAGGGRIINTGEVAGDIAVYMDQTASGSLRNELINSGSLLGRDTGVRTVNEVATIINSGVITSTFDRSATISHANSAAEEDRYELFNSGLIDSAGFAYEGNPSDELIENTGRILGRIELGDGADVYLGRQGRVEGSVSGGQGEDRLVGGSEENVFRGGAQNDVLRGRGGDDDLDGEGGADIVSGGAGDDLIRGGFSADRLLGQNGDDEIYGDEEADRMFGGKGDDLLYGGAFSDEIRGGAGDDFLGGGNGFDLLIGGRGDDRLAGGIAADTFVMRRRSDDDVITDFENKIDVIDLTAFGLRATQYSSVVAPALNDAGGGATFLDLTQLGGNGSVLIQGLVFAEADDTDFLL